MPMIAVFAFVDGEFGRMVVVFGDFGGKLGFFLRGVTDFMSIADPAAFGFVNLVRIQMFISVSHIFLLYHRL